MTAFGTQMHFLQEFASRQLTRFQSFQFNKSMIERMDQIGASFIIGFFVATIALLLFLWRRMRINEKVAILSDSSKPRFRKRDKVMFYGRKMLRKVRSSLQGSGRTVRVKKRQLVMKFAKKLLRLKKEQPMQLQVKEPSQAFLEEDITHLELDGRLPAEVIYMLRNIRVFGFFDRPLFLELCKKIEFINVPKGKLLFCIGDDDDSMYIVQRGKLEVFASEPDGSELTLKEAIAGDPIFSLLSVMDVLSGHLAPFKTVSVRALDESTVLRLQIGVFRDLLEKYPELLVRVVQIIMVRLQRVTFTALHNYLGLTTQLVNPGCLSGHKRMTPNSDLQTSQMVPNASPPKASPSRPNRVSVIHQFQYSQSCPEYDDKGLKSVLKDMADMELSGDDYSTLDVDKTQQKSLSQSPVKPSSMSMYGDSFKQKRRKSTVYCDDPIVGLSDGEVLKLAVDGFMKEMCINDDTIIKEMVIVREHGAGVFLTHEDAYDEASLFYVLSGSLMVSQKNVDKEDESNLFAAYPGEIVGALAVITGEASAFTIRTRHPSRIGVISKEHTYEILAEYPKVVLQLAHSVVRRLSPFVRQIDFALDWGTYESGRAIYRQGDLSDNTFIVLSGRLRSVLTRQNGKKELVGEYGRGDLVGIVEVLTQTKRSTTVMAVRDTEIAKLPSGLLDVIKIKHPVIVTRLIHLLGHRLLGTLQKIDDAVAPEAVGSRPSGSNFATVAVLSVNEEVPLQAFCMELKHALSAVGSSLYLTSDIIRKTLGTSALETSSEYRLCSWLGQQEDQHRIVLYQCDSTFTPWTQRCIRQADCILIIACADQQPTVGKLEQQLDSFAVRTQKEFILLHKEDSEKPRDTVKWLNMRSWCSSHHHIRCPLRMFQNRRSPAKTKEYLHGFDTAPDIHSDFSRLARFLTGTSIGLVLSGGGARGAAHVGMIKAISEAGIPVDFVAGVSIGSFMGALWCQEMNLKTFTEKARNWSYGMTSYWRQILDLTYPVAAMFTGAAFNRTIYEVFGDRQIEDLWLPYFTLTTDIISSGPRIHRHGSLWRYVRSSMSLSGYLPPLCDPVDGHLLLDGGYVNNCPADVMHEVMGVKTIIAVDVGSQYDDDTTNYGDTLNGWWLLWKRWNPFSKPVKVPNLPEIQSRLAYVSCVRQLEKVRRSDYVTYIRPPIDRFKTLQFGSFDQIREIGYEHGRTLFSAMSVEHSKSLHSYLQCDKNKVYSHQGIDLKSEASFTDLAEKVCKIQTPKRNFSFEESSDYSEDDDFYISDPEIQMERIDKLEESRTVRHRKVSNML